MKCPERFIVLNSTAERAILNGDSICVGKVNTFIEHQAFAECYEEKCAAWDKEKKICRKVREY